MLESVYGQSETELYMQNHLADPATIASLNQFKDFCSEDQYWLKIVLNHSTRSDPEIGTQRRP